MKVGEEYKVLIERYNDQGDGIGFIDNKIIFIKKAIPGEEVTVKVDVIKKNYMVGTLISIEKESPNRVVSECKYYNSCGGCQLNHIDYQEQLKFKQEKVVSILKRYANLEVADVKIVASQPFNYRNKVTLKVNNGKLGYYQARTNTLIAIDECIIASKNINNLMKKLSKIFKQTENQYEIVIKEGNDDLMLIINAYEPEDKILQDIILLDCKTIFLNNDVIKGEVNIHKNIHDLSFKLAKESFFQVNDEIMGELFSYVKDLIGKQQVILDLYSGVGIIASVVAGNANKVIGVELNEAAVRAGDLMLKDNNIKNVGVINQDVSEYLSDFDGAVDTIIVDPPRKGLENEVIQKIIAIKPAMLIYISCDPMTLARDAKLFLEAGYRVENIQLYDMFPNTYHVETVVKFVL